MESHRANLASQLLATRNRVTAIPTGLKSQSQDQLLLNPTTTLKCTKGLSDRPQDGELRRAKQNKILHTIYIVKQICIYSSRIFLILANFKIKKAIF